MKKKISATVLADSINPYGDRITTMILVYPRFILPELNTHHNFIANGIVVHNSRAIPFKKMVKQVEEDPFIPIAWQKDHRGMQGTEYWSDEKQYGLRWKTIHDDSSYYDTHEEYFESENIRDLIYLKWGGIWDEEMMQDIQYIHPGSNYNHSNTELIDRPYTDALKEDWLEAKDYAIKAANKLDSKEVTKQLCNRLLEPFQWMTTLITATEFDGFFELRCPKYLDSSGVSHKSKKDYRKNSEWSCWKGNENDIIGWLECNDSQAEIHIQALAESMLDARNESNPKELKEGEWHIPFGDKFDMDEITKMIDQTKESLEFIPLKIATARCARISYLNHEGNIDYKKDMELHDKLLKSKHASAFEHCAKVPTEEEYYSSIKGFYPTSREVDGEIFNMEHYPTLGNSITKHEYGWFDNFKGFQSYRNILKL